MPIRMAEDARAERGADCRVHARAAAWILGADRWDEATRRRLRRRRAWNAHAGSHRDGRHTTRPGPAQGRNPDHPTGNGGLTPEPHEGLMDLERMPPAHGVLQEARFAGLRSVSYDGKTVTYGSDAELAAAIRDLEGRIATASAGPRRRRAGAPWPRRALTHGLRRLPRRLGSIIGGFDAAQSHRRMRGFRPPGVPM